MVGELPDSRGRDFRAPQVVEAPAYVAAFTSHAEWFGSFIQNTDQKSVQERALLEGLQRFPQVWDRAIDPFQEFRILILGAGTGVSEIAALRQLRELRRDMGRVRVFVEEPSSEMQREFLGNAHRASVDDTIQGFETRGFEDPTYQPEPVDLAVGFQMWQYVKGWEGVPGSENSLDKLRAVVAEREGAAVISVMSETSDSHALRNKYLPMIHGSSVRETTAEMVSSELYGLTIPHDIIIDPAKLNVSSLFQDGQFSPTQEGRNILSFILRTSWENLPIELQTQVANDILRLISSYPQDQHLAFRDAYVWLPGSDN